MQKNDLDVNIKFDDGREYQFHIPPFLSFFKRLTDTGNRQYNMMVIGTNATKNLNEKTKPLDDAEWQQRNGQELIGFWHEIFWGYLWPDES